MTFQDIAASIQDIRTALMENPDLGFMKFKNKWIELNTEERKQLAPGLIEYCTLKLTTTNPQPSTTEAHRACFNAILNFINGHYAGQPWFGHLDIGEKKRRYRTGSRYKIALRFRIYRQHTCRNLASFCVCIQCKSQYIGILFYSKRKAAKRSY